mmetsp:Transcript_11764/g.20471  ORF Transcript_11764/g.20471 Transcript_11764/m.20471 type:complete len:363 (-) Transcript_11764:247-1335(-)
MSIHPTLKYVDHTYRDFSHYVEEGGQLIAHKKSGDNFPARLHKILSEPNNHDAITWMPHGRAWKIRDKNRLIKEVIPNYFVCKKYASFTRQLNGWGFKRLHQSGPDFGCYYHECFLRGIPDLTCLIRRLPPNLGKSTPWAEGEPNFYKLAEKYPLPNRSSCSNAEESRTRVESIDKPRPLTRQALAFDARSPTVYNPNDGILSTLSIRAANQDTPRAETMPSSSEIPYNSANQAGHYYPQSELIYPQDTPYSALSASSYYDGQYYGDNYPSQGQFNTRSNDFYYNNRARNQRQLLMQYSRFSPEQASPFPYQRNYAESPMMPSSYDRRHPSNEEISSHVTQSFAREVSLQSNATSPYDLLNL